MAHRYRHTEKEAHLLSGPSELQLPDDSEAQKLRSPTQVQQPRQEYSRFTETEKAKFQTPSTYNDDRNFVQRNSVEKFSPHLVYHTLQEQGSQHARTLGNQPVHIVTFTCETLSRPGSVDTQYNVELYENL